MTDWAGAVLTGGASRRMGRPKETIAVGGVAMAARVAVALREAGAVAVACVGHDVPGEQCLADDHPGEGPLGGLLTALRWAPADVAVVLACDLLAPSPAAIRRARDALASEPGAHVAVPVVAGRRQWLHAAWSVTACRPPLDAAFAGGVRSVWSAVEGVLVVLAYDEPLVDALADADTPDQLPPGVG